MEQRIDQLHADGIVDLHFDMPMDLYEKRNRTSVLATDFLPDFEAGNIGVLGVAIYVEDRYLPEMGLRVALDQISRLYAEAEGSGRFAICKSYENILDARKARKIALLITMEGVEPLGTDRELLRSVLRAWRAGNRTHPCPAQCRRCWRRSSRQAVLRATD